MKRRLTSVLLAFCFAFSSAGFVYAADSDTDVQEETETTTEETTEEETETTTESATTTTRDQSDDDDDDYDEVKDDFDITVNADGTKSLSSYIPASAPDVSDFDWDTSDSSIATVNSSGRLTAKKRGSCTITATASEGNTDYTYTFYVTVRNNSAESITIDVDEEEDLYDYVDDDYEARDYDWDTSNERYVTVTSRGVITGVREGEATVTATYEDDDVSLEYEFEITVEDDSSSNDDDDDDDEVEVKTTWDIYVGTDDEVDISDLLEDYPDDYDWTVDDEDIAEIDEDDGIITGLEEGDTVIRAEGDTDYRFNVNVGDDYSTDEVTVDGDETVDLEDYLDDDADYYSFESDRRDVAKVTSSGVVSGVANGMATIICEHDEDDSIIQIFVTVEGIRSTTTTTTTTEATTESTTSAPVTQATTVAVSFSDISHRAWAVDAIKAMASKGYIVGVGADKFSPDANCKRCDFAIVLMKMLNLSDSDVNAEYDDISSKDYYYDYVMAALANGIEAGVTNNEFRPDDYITREEVMVMVYKGLVKAGVSMDTDTSVLGDFTDASSIASENREAVAALINSGAISGTSDTTLEPKANITRAQMAVIMNNVDQTVNG